MVGLLIFVDFLGLLLFVRVVGDSPGALTVGKLVGVVGYNISRKFKSLFGSPSFTQYTRRVITKDLDFVSSLLKDGSLKVIVDSASPFAFTTEGAVAMFNKQNAGYVFVCYLATAKVNPDFQ